jgi:integrase
MLTQQQEDFGFQAFVAPRVIPVGGEYHPYSLERFSKAGRAVMRAANLPEELRLMDLRRTGTTQMVEAGVPMGQIMSVTGHSNPQSVKPYMKNTYASANSALTARKSHGKST